MRLLHTADWHLGRRLFGVERLDEARAVLADLARVAREERVAATLVAGDLLDRRLVEPAVLGVCLEAFRALADVAPVLAIAGNHDDPAFWTHLEPYLAGAGVHVAGRPVPPERAVLSLDTPSGPLHVARLPWVDPAALGAELGAGIRRARGTYADDVASMVSGCAQELRRRRAASGGAAVLLGHLLVDGARPGAGERELTLGMAYAVSPAAIPTDLDYVALGHVHRPQRIPGSAAAGRYAGSPLALDFSEDNHAKSAAVVEIAIEAGADTTRVREVPLSGGRPLARIRGPLEALAPLAAHHPGAYFLCEVELERVVLDLVAEVRERVPDALRIEARYPATEAVGADGGPGGGAAAPETRSLAEHYADWHARRGVPLDPRQAEAFAAALAAGEAGAANEAD